MKSIGDIDTSIEEGRVLLAAIATLSSCAEYRTMDHHTILESQIDIAKFMFRDEPDLATKTAVGEIHKEFVLLTLDMVKHIKRGNYTPELLFEMRENIAAIKEGRA